MCRVHAGDSGYEYVDCLDLFFFFQAEDGIRDLTVTGVQTCALPILARQAPWWEEWPVPGQARCCLTPRAGPAGAAAANAERTEGSWTKPWISGWVSRVGRKQIGRAHV